MPQFDVTDLARHTEFLRRLARHLVRSPDLAEDAVQDTLILTWNRRPHVENLRAWMARSLRNVVRNRRRESNRRENRRRDSRYQVAASTRMALKPEVLLEQQDTRNRLFRAVVALPTLEREIVVLEFSEGLSPSAIASELGISRNTVYTRRRRGLARMQSMLRSEFESSDRDYRTVLVGLFAIPTRSITSAAIGASIVGKKLAMGGALIALLSVGAWSVLHDPSTDTEGQDGVYDVLHQGGEERSPTLKVTERVGATSQLQVERVSAEPSSLVIARVVVRDANGTKTSRTNGVVHFRHRDSDAVEEARVVEGRLRLEVPAGVTKEHLKSVLLPVRGKFEGQWAVAKHLVVGTLHQVEVESALRWPNGDTIEMQYIPEIRTRVVDGASGKDLDHVVVQPWPRHEPLFRHVNGRERESLKGASSPVDIDLAEADCEWGPNGIKLDIRAWAPGYGWSRKTLIAGRNNVVKLRKAGSLHLTVTGEIPKMNGWLDIVDRLRGTTVLHTPLTLGELPLVQGLAPHPYEAVAYVQIKGNDVTLTREAFHVRSHEESEVILESQQAPKQEPFVGTVILRDSRPASEVELRIRRGDGPWKTLSTHREGANKLVPTRGKTNRWTFDLGLEYPGKYYILFRKPELRVMSLRPAPKPGENPIRTVKMRRSDGTITTVQTGHPGKVIRGHEGVLIVLPALKRVRIRVKGLESFGLASKHQLLWKLSDMTFGTQFSRLERSDRTSLHQPMAATRTDDPQVFELRTSSSSIRVTPGPHADYWFAPDLIHVRMANASRTITAKPFGYLEVGFPKSVLSSQDVLDAVRLIRLDAGENVAYAPSKPIESASAIRFKIRRPGRYRVEVVDHPKLARDFDPRLVDVVLGETQRVEFTK